jgi:hypothetical protein
MTVSGEPAGFNQAGQLFPLSHLSSVESSRKAPKVASWRVLPGTPSSIWLFFWLLSAAFPISQAAKFRTRYIAFVDAGYHA